MAQLVSVNPYTKQSIARYKAHPLTTIFSILDTVHKASLQTAEMSVAERVAPMLKLAEILRTESDDIALLITREMGKPITQSRAEIEKCAVCCEYVAHHAETLLAAHEIATHHHYSGVVYRPLGVILGVMPWNYPLWQVIRFALPALAVGNTIALKHAPNVTGCALLLESLFVRAGFPVNALRCILIAPEKTAAYSALIIQSPRIRGVACTGSTHAGSAIAEIAGSALKKTVLELGGSDPYIVLADANIEQAVKLCAASRLLNNGQSCIAAKRFIVEKSVADQFTEALIEEFTTYAIGDPEDPATRLSTLATERLRSMLAEQVDNSIGQGAIPRLGGSHRVGNGSSYLPTILTNVHTAMLVMEQETFGPVAPIIVARHEHHAIEIANTSHYGLGAAIFSRNVAHATYLAEHRVRAGMCAINEMVKSDPRLPFGGIGMSGYGRELSMMGFYEFANVKTLMVEQAG